MICHMFGAKPLPKVPLPSIEPLRINLIKIWKKKPFFQKNVFECMSSHIWGGNILNHQNAINLTDQYTINLMNANDMIMRLMTISLTSHDTVGGLLDSTCEQWPVDSLDKGTAMPFMRFLLLAWTSGWRNNPGACDLRPHDAHVTPL